MSTPIPEFFAGGGAMGERLRAWDWEQTPLGAPATWPASLKTLVAVMLASNQPMYLAWGPSRTLIYNDDYVSILGQKHPEALGRDFLEVWHEIREELEPMVATALAGNPVQMPDISLLLHRNGYPERAYFSFFYAPVRGDGGAIDGIFGACAEITARVLAEEALARSEARLRSVLANMDEAFFLLDLDFIVQDVNAVALHLAERTREDVVGQELWTLDPEAYDSEAGRMYRRAIASSEPGHVEYSYELADGLHWFEARAYPVDQGLAVFLRDVSERRRMLGQARLAAERIQLALDAGAIVGTWVWSIPDNRLIADARFASSFGLDPAHCEAGLPLDLAMASIHDEDQLRVAETITQVLAHGEAYRCEYRVRHANGSMRWVEANGEVERDAEGRPVRFPGVLLDIEERRRTAAERDQANALLRTFIEAVPGVVYAKDYAGRLIVGNRGVSELLGRPPEAFLGRTDGELLTDAAEAKAIMETDRHIMDSGVTQQIQEDVQLADGTPAVWLSTKAPLRDDEGTVIGLIGSSVDITELKRTEDALRRSEQRSALALEVARLGTWEWDPLTNEVRMDARTRQIVGAPVRPEELSLEALSSRIHPEDRARILEALSRTLEPESSGLYAEEFRWIHPQGHVVWTMARGQLLFDGLSSRRTPATMIGSILDVTERQRMIETLEQNDRRKDEFLAMLAHELRNPLAPIGTAAQLLQIAPDDEPRVRHVGEVISRQVAHMTELVDDLLDVSRVTRGLVKLAQEPVDMSTVVTAALEQAAPLIQSRGHQLVTTSPGPAHVLGDRHRLVQVVTNLLNNAAKYTASGGRLELWHGCDESHVIIRVTDSGIGMEEGLVPHVFDLFAQAERTPDRSQGGLGIGLALVRSIVQLHGGSVVASSPGLGLGSTFTVILPRMGATAAHATETRPRTLLEVLRGSAHEP